MAIVRDMSGCCRAPPVDLDGVGWVVDNVSRIPTSGACAGASVDGAGGRRNSLGRRGGRQHLLDRLEALELRGTEIEALAGAGVAVGGSEGFGARPVVEG